MCYLTSTSIQPSKEILLLLKIRLLKITRLLRVLSREIVFSITCSNLRCSKLYFLNVLAKIVNLSILMSQTVVNWHPAGLFWTRVYVPSVQEVLRRQALTFQTVSKKSLPYFAKHTQELPQHAIPYTERERVHIRLKVHVSCQIFSIVCKQSNVVVRAINRQTNPF